MYDTRTRTDTCTETNRSCVKIRYTYICNSNNHMHGRISFFFVVLSIFIVLTYWIRPNWEPLLTNWSLCVIEMDIRHSPIFSRIYVDYEKKSGEKCEDLSPEGMRFWSCVNWLIPFQYGWCQKWFNVTVYPKNLMICDRNLSFHACQSSIGNSIHSMRSPHIHVNSIFVTHSSYSRLYISQQESWY